MKHSERHGNSWSILARAPLLASTFLVMGGVSGAAEIGQQREVDALLERLLKPPVIEAKPGMTAEILVPPGHLYDPLFIHSRGGAVWLNDDGGEEGTKGSRILALTDSGELSVLVELGRLLPATGFDVAPEGFGTYAGHIFTLAQAEVAAPGAVANHVVQRVDPNGQAPAETHCTLLPAGSANEGISGFGVDARFGPDDSPFADTFYAITAYNNTVYQVKPDGSCTPFVTFENWAGPAGLAFSPDGKTMLVSVTRGSLTEIPEPGQGAIVRVHPDGRVDRAPVAEGLTRPTGMAYAPAGFGAYGGELFVADAGDMEFPVPMTQTLTADGVLYRVTAEGTLDRIAGGLYNPMGLGFMDGALWVGDINGDFIAGRRELPDGFVLRLTGNEQQQ